ncbi:alpha/beta fold hydrolase [Devosia chinhatensis]|uniref:AB hydrolase-1 domain-containing protein n=1 Tax=Devosia chinhatensis TaxID=429727 RepID=A0A0F5FNE9_9HYPH|nr:alpha/beta hydrolase [Devosia chinhatensis]KKB10070.1 hypothetical protein VE26_09820 [Devosia chinhatensis]
MIEKYVQRPNAQLYTQAWGQPLRGTILLAMGATASSAWWPIALIDALAGAGYQVIVFDHRDTGRSTLFPPGTPPYDLPDLVEDVIAILDAYAVSSVHLVGMSLGGLVAQIVTLQHPGRVATLTVFAGEPLNSAYDGEGMPPEIMEHFSGMATLDWSRREDVTQFLLRIAELSAAPDRPFDRHAALERIGRELDHTSAIQSAFNHAMLEGKIDPGLHAADITRPTLVIHGAGDPLISVAAAKKTHELIPNARLTVLEKVGHEITPAEIPTLSQAILGFIRSAPTVQRA